MLTRRQFIGGCASAFLAVAGLSIVAKKDMIANLVGSIPVLLYHRVGSDADELTISIERFRNDLEYLKSKGYQTISLNQAMERARGNDAGVLGKPIIITFDDGYLDNYTNAFPVLQEFAMIASFYIITGMVGQSERMSIAQIREMESYGMSFGSHTVSHRKLGELPHNEAKMELQKSKDDLEQILGNSVESLAYPCGSYSVDTLRIAGESGYSGGFTTHMGFSTIPNNKLTINRIPIFRRDRSIEFVMLRKGLIKSVFS